jgi:hypothetical protein
MPFEPFTWPDERAASLHGLLVLVSAGLVNTFKRLPLATSKEICDFLRNPGLGLLCFFSLAVNILRESLDDDNDLSVIIRRSVIPTIHHLQRRLPEESFTAVLGSDLVSRQFSSLQLDPSFLCSDLRQSDIFFDSLKKK